MELTRKVLVECPKCEGAGTCKNASGETSTCGHCHGTGKMEYEKSTFRSYTVEK